QSALLRQGAPNSPGLGAASTSGKLIGVSLGPSTKVLLSKVTLTLLSPASSLLYATRKRFPLRRHYHP
ncbi:MAG: hypothetical protein ACKN9E_04735, partial [Microcystaceae cyanobacterium]